MCQGTTHVGREENNGVDALGVFPGRVCRFPEPPPLAPGQEFRRKVPHMGWNAATFLDPSDSIVDGLVSEVDQFYFVHSY